MKKNLLAESLSPYLLQHKDNPVHWRVWGAAALEEARIENKPILLSVGYSSCHWCHVMAHESFENPAIAEVMNAHFINIKVDREERPDIDAIYMRALQLTGESGGWPLTMFLTPNAEPFWGGTYFPPQSRFGRPGFPDVLHNIARVFAEEPDKIASAASAMKEGLQTLSRPTLPGSLPPEEISPWTNRFLQLTDSKHGGIPASAPKFPQTIALELLWRSWRRDGNAASRDAVLKALDAMCQGGIYDHLGGGFYRYSTDRHWLVPHFEKMLYDNALLLSLLTCVWQDNANPLYQQRIEESIDWLLREMRLDGGAFAASIDADSPGGEGSFYVWREEEIDALLGDDSETFKTIYDVSAKGNWEGVCILNRNHKYANATTDEATLASMRAHLFAAREKRERPQRDDKILTDWTGLMIAALAQAGATLQRDDWMQAATTAFDFIVKEMGTEDARLFHAKRGETSGMGFSTDYANMIHAALLLYQLCGEQKFLQQAQAWIATLDRDYGATDGEGYFDTAKTGEELILRLRSGEDGSQPCANFIMAECFATLFHLTGEDHWRCRCEDLLASEAGSLDERFFSLAGLLCAADQLYHATRVEVFGNDNTSAALLRVARGLAGPGLIVTRSKGEESGAVVCRGEKCSLPIRDAELLRRELKRVGVI